MRKLLLSTKDIILFGIYQLCRLYVMWFFGYKNWPYKHDLYDLLDSRDYDRIFDE